MADDIRRRYEYAFEKGLFLEMFDRFTKFCQNECCDWCGFSALQDDHADCYNEWLCEYITEEQFDLEALEDDEDWGVDPCDECAGYGDDYSFDDHGDLVSNCPTCPFNISKKETDDE